MGFKLERGVYDSFASGHLGEQTKIPQGQPSTFLRPIPNKSQNGLVYTYALINRIDEEISDYAFQRLKEFSGILRHEADSDFRKQLVQMGKWVKQDYDELNKQRGIFSKFWNSVLIAIGVRHSSNEIEEQLASLERLTVVPQFGGSIGIVDAEARISSHRNAGNNNDLAKSYAKDSLTGARDKIFAELVKNTPLPSTEPHKQIALAKLKEQAAREVYDKFMTAQTKKGYYDPGAIPLEIDQMFKPLGPLPLKIRDLSHLNQLLSKEVEKYKIHLSSHQVHYIKDDIQEAMKLYLKAYGPGKTLLDAFSLGRDMIRVAVYQEIFDKGSFTGSDHGSKHIHHNIKNGDGLHSNMLAGRDFNAKDHFMEHFIHFYHDIGYTTGLSANSFDCCKDHPFIGAKMIDENREYFKYYLGDDDAAVDVFKEGVLLHSIAMPNLTTDKAEEMRGGMHPNMIRAVTSISDACAVTYDRKTQEFWEQPASLIALSRLRLFLTQYPQYIDKLKDPSGDEWFNGELDQNKPLDVLAHDVFKATKDDLFAAVEKYDVPKAKKELFREAIARQFNSFTTATTLGQYGGVMIGVSAVRNEDQAIDAPTYLPEFALAPSIIYGLLKDVYGPDLAQQSFKKLLEEFGVDIGTISEQLDRLAEARTQEKIVPERNFVTKSAKFTLRNLFDVDPKDKHLNQMQRNLAKVVERIRVIYHSEVAVMKKNDRDNVFKSLENYRQSNNPRHTFDDFIVQNVLPNLNVKTPQGNRVTEGVLILTQLVENQEDPFVKIRAGETIVAPLYSHLKDPVYAPIKIPLQIYLKEIGKLRTRQPTVAQIDSLNKNLLDEAVKAGVDINLLQTELDALKKSLTTEPDASRMKDAELLFAQLNAVMKMVLLSEEEYRFMRGSKVQTQAVLIEELMGKSRV